MWCLRWRAREPSTSAQRAQAMMQTSPICIARNHQVEAALAAAVERVDLALFERLLTVLSRPFDERADYADHAQPAPLEETTCYKTFCGT